MVRLLWIFSVTCVVMFSLFEPYRLPFTVLGQLFYDNSIEKKSLMNCALIDPELK